MQRVRTGSRPGCPPAKIIPLGFHSIRHTLGTDYGCCRDGVHTLMLRSVFSTFDIDLGVFHSVHTPSKLLLTPSGKPSVQSVF